MPKKPIPQSLPDAKVPPQVSSQIPPQEPPQVPSQVSPQASLQASSQMPPQIQEIFEGDNPAGAVSPEHAILVETLLAWFERGQRDLPWRKTYSPYHVWISEIMLQQTQMERGASYFSRWIERFPTVHDVANAHPDDLLKAWEGLGYYSRVRNLQKAAQIIVSEHGGELPTDKAALLSLPGVGEYTAGAILSIAYNMPCAAVDANVERVFARLFDVAAPVKSPPASGFIRHMAESLLPEGKAREYTQALMEFGALVCTKKPRCADCPVQHFCQSYHLGIVAERPIAGKKAPYTSLEIISGVLVHKGRVFVQKRLDSGVWVGFWEFPGGRLEPEESPEQGVVREFGEETEFPIVVRRYLGLVRHAYTRYKIEMHCFLCAMDDGAAVASDQCGARSGVPAPIAVPTSASIASPASIAASTSIAVPAPAPAYIRYDERGFPVPQLSAATEYRWLLPEELNDITLPAGHRKLVDTWFDCIKGAAVADKTRE